MSRPLCALPTRHNASTSSPAASAMDAAAAPPPRRFAGTACQRHEPPLFVAAYVTPCPPRTSAPRRYAANSSGRKRVYYEVWRRWRERHAAGRKRDGGKPRYDVGATPPPLASMRRAAAPPRRRHMARRHMPPAPRQPTRCDTPNATYAADKYVVAATDLNASSTPSVRAATPAAGARVTAAATPRYTHAVIAASAFHQRRYGSPCPTFVDERHGALRAVEPCRLPRARRR
ncbi:hypothetical protein NPIL_147491 [Nephila pilipes]|uniref:Uncharacterized protein n=1 Tax=Nephila pilipes TaxID=299642 RepID=A0A8X6N3Q9_NEPPI|nr:hypothetical protein NPIL_147491 [Nephila pilipes]